MHSLTANPEQRSSSILENGSFNCWEVIVSQHLIDALLGWRVILLRFSYLDYEYQTPPTVNHHANENCSTVAKQIVLSTNFELLLRTNMKNENERVALILAVAVSGSIIPDSSLLRPTTTPLTSSAAVNQLVLFT